MSSTTRWTDDHFIAGHPALDFANTVYQRRPELGRDLLDSAGALARWLERAGLLSSAESRVLVDDASLAEARNVRGLLWRVFDAQIDGQPLPTEALADLFGVVRDGLDLGLSVAADGSPAPLTARGACAALALEGIKLALNPPGRPVRTCDRCGWFFLDTSRGRRRRWCSMQTCGNRAKASRYRSAHS
jgi:predicted RNA-binding Zn ribbon-like protein